MSSLDKLRLMLTANPDNIEIRRQLVEALLEADESKEAAITLAPLLAAFPDEHWVLALGIRVSLDTGDNLQAARLKKRLQTSYVDDLDDDRDDEDDDDWEESIHPARPQVMENEPRLRLLPGGAKQEATLIQGTGQRLENIAGLATIKRNLEEIITAVRNDQTNDRSWLGGAFFYGPPSCGKAFLAEVIASELGATMWYFDLAKDWETRDFSDAVRQAITQSAGNSAVLYLDNLDNDAQGTLVARESVLSLLDSARQTAKVAIFGAATIPWLVNTRVVRPGRLSRVLLVLPPDAPARRTFLINRLDQHFSASEEEIDWLVAHTDGHSFGDLERLIDLATELSDSTQLTHDAIRKARQEVAASSADWLTSAGHHAIMNEGGGLYDDLLEYFRQRQRTK